MKICLLAGGSSCPMLVVMVGSMFLIICYVLLYYSKSVSKILFSTLCGRVTFNVLVRSISLLMAKIASLFLAQLLRAIPLFTS